MLSPASSQGHEIFNTAKNENIETHFNGTDTGEQDAGHLLIMLILLADIMQELPRSHEICLHVVKHFGPTEWNLKRLFAM